MAVSGDVTVAQDGGQGNVKLHPYLVTLVRWCVSCLWSTATVLLHRLTITPLLPIAGPKPSQAKARPVKRPAGTDHLHPVPTVECQVLHQPETHGLDVIFVHGLYGSLGNTWRQGEWKQKYKNSPKKVTLRDHNKNKKCHCDNITEQNGNKRNENINNDNNNVNKEYTNNVKYGNRNMNNENGFTINDTVNEKSNRNENINNDNNNMNNVNNEYTNNGKYRNMKRGINENEFTINDTVNGNECINNGINDEYSPNGTLDNRNNENGKIVDTIKTVNFKQIKENLFKNLKSKNDLITEQFYNNTLLDQVEIVENYDTQANFIRELFEKENNCDNACETEFNRKNIKNNDQYNHNNDNEYTINDKIRQYNEKMYFNERNGVFSQFSEANEFNATNNLYNNQYNSQINETNEYCYKNNEYTEKNNEYTEYSCKKDSYEDTNNEYTEVYNQNNDNEYTDNESECKCNIKVKKCEIGCGCVCDECYSDCWPKDWIKVDYPEARVISINYTSDPYLWRPLWVKENKRLTLHERARQMIDQLLELGVGDKPIIWVGHSKGGLFIKQIYCEAYDAHLKKKSIMQNNNDTNTNNEMDNRINESHNGNNRLNDNENGINDNGRSYNRNGISDNGSETSDNRSETSDDRSETSDRENAISHTRSETSHQDNRISHTRSETSDQDNRISHTRSETSDQENGISDNRSETSDRENGISHTRSETSDQENGISHTRSETSDQENGISHTRSETSDQETGISDNRSETSDQENEISEDRSETSDQESGISEDFNSNNLKRNKNVHFKGTVADELDETSHIEDISKLWSNSMGFMFYSVPHRGSPLADIKTPLTARSIELIEITKDCELVCDLQSRWNEATLPSCPAVSSFVETCRTLMSVLWLRIVSVHSADAGIGTLYGVSVDHREICKPSSRKCLLYKELVALIRDALNKCRC